MNLNYIPQKADINLFSWWAKSLILSLFLFNFPKKNGSDTYSLIINPPAGFWVNYRWFCSGLCHMGEKRSNENRCLICTVYLNSGCHHSLPHRWGCWRNGWRYTGCFWRCDRATWRYGTIRIDSPLRSRVSVNSKLEFNLQKITAYSNCCAT